MEAVEKAVLIESFKWRYHRSGRKEKSGLLTERSEALGVH